MVDLALNSTTEQVSLNSIAERQKISVHYLEQVFSLLKKGGLVKSVKGSQGGYILAENPVKITVGVILRALEGDLLITDENETMPSPDSIEYCLTINVWNKLNDSINSLVDSITLEDLVNNYKTLNINMAIMAYI